MMLNGMLRRPAHGTSAGAGPDLTLTMYALYPYGVCCRFLGGRWFASVLSPAGWARAHESKCSYCAQRLDRLDRVG